MNLKMETQFLKLTITDGDASTIEKALYAVFASIEGKSSVEAFKTHDKSTTFTRNYIEVVDGVRTHGNGIKTYKCAYTCVCGEKGVRYVSLDSEKTTCHKCKGELVIAPSTKNDAHDANFNYFLAN